jgi:hypothetical protein
MAKKPVDDIREPVTVDFQSAKFPLTLEGVKAASELSQSATRLIQSGIISGQEGTEITWRMGHLLHIANLYRSNPAQTERDYADDIAVARAYSADVWEALIK